MQVHFPKVWSSFLKEKIVSDVFDVVSQLEKRVLKQTLDLGLEGSVGEAILETACAAKVPGQDFRVF